MANTEIKMYDKLTDEARAIREEVFMGEQGFSYDYDEIDEAAKHFVMFVDGDAAAACRVFSGEDEGTYVAGRFAVKKECRGKKLGSLLLDAVKDYVNAAGGEYIILHSQLQAKEFYKKNGFCEYGEIEYEEGCPHISMKFAVK